MTTMPKYIAVVRSTSGSPWSVWVDDNNEAITNSSKYALARQAYNQWGESNVYIMERQEIIKTMIDFVD